MKGDLAEVFSGGDCFLPWERLYAVIRMPGVFG